MIHVAEIYLWGTKIGTIQNSENTNYSVFEYDRNFLQSGIELSPLHMPLAGNTYRFPVLAGEPFFGMPGLVADSLPDKFGNALIEQWLASQGRSVTDFTAIERLCYTGKRGMGALEYVPALGPSGDINEPIDVNEMVKFASEILCNRENAVLNVTDDLTYSQLLQVGSSAGGARAKALIAWNEETNEIRSGQIMPGDGFTHWLMKFDTVTGNGDHGLTDRREYTLIEYAYYKMALAAGLQMEECRIYSLEGANHFMTKRFDRVNNDKLHMQSLGALAHISYNEPGLCSYEQAAGYMKEIGLSQKDIEQFYRRMVFNHIAVNYDDHVKNFSFLMDRAGTWRLAPAYDITFSYKADNRWLKAHQMRINGKTDDLVYNDLLAAGNTMGLRKDLCEDIIEKITAAVNRFPEFAGEAGVREETMSDLLKTILEKYDALTSDNRDRSHGNNPINLD